MDLERSYYHFNGISKREQIILLVTIIIDRKSISLHANDLYTVYFTSLGVAFCSSSFNVCCGLFTLLKKIIAAMIYGL